MTRVLIDECLPRPLAGVLVGFDVVTVPEAGWAGRSNGELLELAEREFDVFVTIDQNLIHQEVVPGRSLGVVVLQASSNRFEAIAPMVPRLIDALEWIRPGEMRVVA